jgi:hypothetical protein
MYLLKEINEIFLMKLLKNGKRFYLGLLLCPVALLNLTATPPLVDGVNDPVTPGQWHSDLDAALTYSEQNDIPLLYIWGVQGCAHSDRLDDYLNTAAFTQWAAARKPVMVYIKAADTTTTDEKEFARIGVNGTLTEYPLAAVYWNSSNAQPFNFSGRYTASSNTDGAEQLISEAEFYITGYLTPVSYPEWTDDEDIPLALRDYEDTPADDGIANLIKYACGLPAMTPATTADLMTIVENPELNTFAVIYYKSRSAEDVILEPVWADALSGPWLTTGITLEMLAEDGVLEQWKASISKADQGFIRLRATAD